jgi:hypothetical protein
MRLDREEGMSAQVEEVIVDAHTIDTEDTLKDINDLLLGAAGGRLVNRGLCRR